MNNLSCELCGGTQFAKTDGFFVCQSCGLKYSPEELRKLMGVTEKQAAPAVAPAPAAPQAQYYAPAAAAPAPAAPQAQYYAPAAAAPAPAAPQAQYYAPAAAAPAPAAPQAQYYAPAAAAPAPAAPQVGSQKEAKDPKKDKKKGKFPIGYIFLGAFLVAAIAYFIVSLTLAMNPEDNTGNVMLIASGILELLIAFIIYKGWMHLERYRCPACASKRVHHREYLYTSDVDKDHGKYGFTTVYTHHYEDTYVCPKCGETMSEQVQKSGGEYRELSTGQIQDARRPPKEF